MSTQAILVLALSCALIPSPPASVFPLAGAGLQGMHPVFWNLPTAALMGLQAGLYLVSLVM